MGNHGSRTTGIIAGAVATVLAGIAAIVVAPRACTAAAESTHGGKDRVDKTSRLAFDATLDRLEATAKGEHLMVIATIDHKKILSMVGAKLRGSTTLEVGKPEMGKMLLSTDPAIGLEIPVRIFVHEAPDGKVIVSYRKVSPIFATYENPEISKAGDMLDAVLDKITSSVATTASE